jgi:hypothetical protein
MGRRRSVSPVTEPSGSHEAAKRSSIGAIDRLGPHRASRASAGGGHAVARRPHRDAVFVPAAPALLTEQGVIKEAQRRDVGLS